MQGSSVTVCWATEVSARLHAVGKVSPRRLTLVLVGAFVFVVASPCFL